MRHQLSHRQVEAAKYIKVELCIYRISLAKVSKSSSICALKKDMLACVKGICQSSNEVRLKMWFVGENHLMCVCVE